MNFHGVPTHLKDNWHKYGVIILIIKEFRIIYHITEKIKNFKESWIYTKISGLFQK